MAKRAPTRAKSGSLDATTRILVLCGQEEMVKRQRLTQLRETLEAEHGQVETFQFDGVRATLADVLDELRAYSLMSTYKVVIVDDADEFVKRHREALARYAQGPVDHATLVLRSVTWNKGNLDKLIEKVGAIIKCDNLSDAEARDEVIRRAQHEHGRKIAPAAAALLVERLGPELMKLDTELAKLALMVPVGGTIEPKLIEETVGRTSDEQAWVVQDAALRAMERGNPAEVLSMVHELVDLAGQPDVLVTYFVADLVRKLNVALMMKRQGQPDLAIGKALKLWGPRQSLFMNVVRKLDAGRAARLLEAVVAADSRSKSGLGDAMLNLECFCVRLTDSDR